MADASIIISGTAAAVALVALGAGRYDRWKATKERREDREAARRQRQEDLERAAQQRQEDLERARPGFLIEWNWNAGASGFWIGMNINTLPGRPGTSIVEAGFALPDLVSMDNVEGLGPDPVHAEGHGSFPILRELTACEPGHRHTFTVKLYGLGPLIDPETELIPYVLDIEGTRHQGPPMAVFNRLMEEGWEPDDIEVPTFPVLQVTYTHPPERAGEVGTFPLMDRVPDDLLSAATNAALRLLSASSPGEVSGEDVARELGRPVDDPALYHSLRSAHARGDLECQAWAGGMGLPGIIRRGRGSGPSQ